jgi:hypothetical protein
LVDRAVTVTFRRVQRFVQWANAGATATELRAKNAPRFLLDSGVRIDPVIRSHSALPFFSFPPICSGCIEEPRAGIVLVVSYFRVGFFSSFSVFLFGGLSSHSNFSTSAAICAMGERGCNRNRVTDQECINSNFILIF